MAHRGFLANAKINVTGVHATGVAYHDYSNAPSTNVGANNDGKGDNAGPKPTNSTKASKMPFDYTEYVNPESIEIQSYEKGAVDDFAKPRYERYKVSVKDVKKRGKALIINVRGNGDKERVGSEIDVRKMDILWKKLEFEVNVYDSCSSATKAEIERVLQETAGIYGGVGAIVIIIMSHGKLVDGEEVFITSDCKFIKFNDVIALFDNKNARSLRGIPKLFFFQYCRGSLRDFAEDEDITIEKFSALKVKEGDIAEDEKEGDLDDLPSKSDMMVAHASMPGFKALRYPSKGSWFFTVIANVFSRHARDEHVLELMTRVNSAMAAKTYVDADGNKRKQMNEVKFDLTKRLYLLKCVKVRK